MIWALSFGFTGIGGGGVLLGVSRETRERWRVFRDSSSSARAVEVWED